MKCFSLCNVDKNDQPKTSRSILTRSSTSISTSRDVRKSSSEFSSLNDSDTSTEFSTRISFKSLSQRSNDPKVFTSEELKAATKNFSHSLMIGEGGFGGVFRGVIRDTKDSNKKISIAVKQLSRRGLQGHKEWVTEVNVLGVVEHPNLVKLLGYCAEDDERGMQRLLVYEYMPNRSVQDHLSSQFRAPLPWNIRLKIAQDAARGLAYLHEEMEFQIIFRDFKSSNILLDNQWNAKLSDFGLARLGPLDGLSHVSTAVIGTVGYAAPEYIQTGRLTSKSDVWSYGVFLYELITGRRPLDQNRPKNEQKLLEWVRPHLGDMRKFLLIMDPQLDGKRFHHSARKLAAIANRCLVRQPKARPKMSEVLEMLNQVENAAEIGSIPQLRSKDSTTEDANVKDLKERLMDPIIRESRWLAWDTWRLKLVNSKLNVINARAGG